MENQLLPLTHHKDLQILPTTPYCEWLVFYPKTLDFTTFLGSRFFGFIRLNSKLAGKAPFGETIYKQLSWGEVSDYTSSVSEFVYSIVPGIYIVQLYASFTKNNKGSRMVELRTMRINSDISNGTGTGARIAPSQTSATNITITGIINIPSGYILDCLVDAKSLGETSVTVTGYVIGRRIG